MTLTKFIIKHGAAHCAAKWKVSPRTVAYWREGKTKPQRRTALRIMKVSGLSLMDIYR